MPDADLLPFDAIRYLVDGAPVLLLPAAPGTEQLPALRVDGNAVQACEGWRIAARLGITIIDGPGDAGLAVQGHHEARDADEAWLSWMSAVDEHGGAVVLAFDGWEADTPASEILALAARSGARGGTVEDVPPGQGGES